MKNAEVKERLELIAAKNGGVLTPADVVADAKAKDSPLHAYFEWDTKKAAMAYWLDQARDLITSVRVQVQTEHSVVKSVYYVRDPSAKHDAQGYVSVTELRSDQDRAREALVAEFTRVADLLRRARELAAALDAESDVETLLQSVIGLRQRFTTQETATQ